jgi:hypothetical protein
MHKFVVEAVLELQLKEEHARENAGQDEADDEEEPVA